MNEIYFLIGKLIQSFQTLENSLALLVYFHFCDKTCISKNNQKQALKELLAMNEKTLGQKLSKIKSIKLFESESDLNVLSFIKDKRNYIAHHFFNDNEFGTKADIELRKIELLEIAHNTDMINMALLRMVEDCRKK